MTAACKTISPLRMLLQMTKSGGTSQLVYHGLRLSSRNCDHDYNTTRVHTGNIRVTYGTYEYIRLTYGYIRIHTSNTNVFLIKEALIISLASLFHVSKHVPGSV